MISKGEISQQLGNEFFPVYINGEVSSDDSVMLRFHIEKLKKLKRKIKCVEIGSFLGSSSLFLSRELGTKSILYCIDPWNLDENFIKTLPDNSIYRDKSGDFLYKQFLSNIYQQQTDSEIFIIRSTSYDMASKWNHGSIDLLWIDGDHSFESVINDVKAWLPFLSKDGIICGDDYHENEKGAVVDALQELSSQRNLPQIFVHWCHWWTYINSNTFSASSIKLKSPGLFKDMIKNGCYKSAYNLFCRKIKPSLSNR